MFAYNELSDLVNSNELVTPIKKVNEKIICLNSNNEEVAYNFDDFDFNKTIEERNFIVEPEEAEPPKEYDFDTDNEKWLPKEDAIDIAFSFGYIPKRNINVVKEFEITI